MHARRDQLLFLSMSNGRSFRFSRPNSIWAPVTNVNRTTIHNTYVDKTVVYRNSYSHVSYNGATAAFTRSRPRVK
jgi:hypothetical protein